MVEDPLNDLCNAPQNIKEIDLFTIAWSPRYSAEDKKLLYNIHRLSHPSPYIHLFIKIKKYKYEK
jgi:hypothetical protein